MLEHGLYEQVLNKLFEGKIAEVDRERYYIGERQISKESVMHYARIKEIA